ncbi:MAG: hypothetical protein V1708_03540 [Candidatus Micrarchaeota archaeon]
MAYSAVAARLPQGDEKRLEFVMEYEGIDKSAAVRKMIDVGLCEWKKQEALELLRRGKMTLSAAAKFAGLPLWEMMAAVEERKTAFIRVSRPDIEREQEALKE